MLDAINAEAPNGPQVHLVDTHVHGDLTVSRYRLSNGLEVLHLPDPAVPIFSYQTWFRVGSRNERLGKTGIAHLFEHLMFKGTPTRPEGVFDRTLEGLGARLNAATWLDWTYYYEDVPGPEHLPLVVDLESDRLENMILSTEQLESERKVVVNERKERVDNDPNGRLSELLWSMAYTEHPYGKPTIGWMPDIHGLSLEDCLAFHRTWYAPNNAVVVVAGAADAETLLRLIVKHYGHLPSAELPAYTPPVEPRQTEARRDEVLLPLSAEKLLMGYHAVAANDERHPALEILNEVLFEGDSSRLRRLLVTEGELAAGFGAFVPAFAEPGLYEVSVDLRPGRTAEEAEAVVLAAFADVVAKGLTEAELNKAKARLETRFYLGLQTAQHRAHGLGFWAATLGEPYRVFDGGELYAGVTGEAVQAVAAEVFRPENRTVVIGRPSGAPPEGEDGSMDGSEDGSMDGSEDGEP